MSVQTQYHQLGVSSRKEDVHAAISILDKGIFPNAFCKVTPDVLTGNRKYCLVAHADGVGTKAILAYLYWKETGDISVFRGIAQDAAAMNLNDLACVGMTGPFTYTQSLDRNKRLIPGEVVTEIVEGTNAVFEHMRKYGIDITYSGGETADVGDAVRTLTLNASMQGRMRRDQIIDMNIQPGNIIIGLASFGKASYEDTDNSGIGSNGISLVRHKLFNGCYKDKYPEIFDPYINDIAYTGNYLVDSQLPGMYYSIGKLALSPTRIYSPVVKQILAEVQKVHINGMVHCTGGGQTKCLNHINEKIHIVKDSLFPTPSFFSLLQNASGETGENMYETVNMGHELEIFCHEVAAQGILDICRHFAVPAKAIGRVTSCEAGKQLTIKSPQGEFFYTGKK